jgi:hypothetical protein
MSHYRLVTWLAACAGWALFVISLCLPFSSSEWVGGAAPSVGWDLGLASLLLLPRLLSLLLSDPRSGYVVLLAICNLLFAASPFLFVAEKRWYRKPLIAATVLVCATPLVFHPDHYFIGFYTWCLAFVLVSIAVNLDAKR